MLETFKALILTYKNAPLDIREKVSLNEAGVKGLLEFLKNNTPATDLMVISTCNRTEIYFNAPQDISESILSGLKLVKNLNEEIASYFSLLEGKNAITHLFEVALGLDAQVIGDIQVSGQVKNAYQWSADENMAGPFLHRLMHTVFFANKRVVQETTFKDGAASLSYAAKELAEDLLAGVSNPSILILGVGEIGRDVCLNLQSSRFSNVTIMNRTLEKAEKLATESGFRFASIDELETEIGNANLVISTIGGQTPLIGRKTLAQPILTHKFFIDLSMPRSIEPDIEEIAGIELYNLDDLKEKTTEALNKRKAAIPQVQEIIAQALAEFEDWSREIIVSPAIQKFKNALENIRKEELSRYLKNATAEEVARMEELSRALIQKVVKLPVLQLKAACKRGEAESLAGVLQELFDLDRTSVSNKSPK